MIYWILSFAVVAFTAVDYYLTHYNTEYFNRRGIPTAPLKHKFWNHLKLFIDTETPFYFTYDEWTRKLGKVYGFFLGSRRVLMISDLSMATDILIKKYEDFSQRMIIPLERLDHLWGRRYIMSAMGVQYRRIRSLMTQCFTPANVKKVTPKIDRAAKDFVQIIDDKVQAGDTEADGSLIVQRHCQEFIMDLLCKLVLGTEESLQFKNPYVDKVSQLMASYSRLPVQKYSYLWTWINNLWIPFYEAFNYCFPDKRMKIITDLYVVVTKRKAIRDEVASRGETIKQKDFVDMMIDAEDPTIVESKDFKRKLSPMEVIINCTVLIAGGLETTSSTCITCLYYLAKYPQYQEQLREEIGDYFSSSAAEEEDDVIVFEKLKDAKLLEAFVKEALRLCPSAPQTTNRRTLRTTTIGKDNFEVERGTYVFINNRQLQRDQDIWGADAEEFKPERFFELTTEQKSAYLAFGDGPKICPGILVGSIAVKLMIVRLLQQFKLSPTDKIDQQFEQYFPSTTTTVRIKQLNIKFTKL